MSSRSTTRARAIGSTSRRVRAGRNLAHWLPHDRATLRNILAVFVQAARGLAAAHATGIVTAADQQRVIGRARVRVIDFDVARCRSCDARRRSPPPGERAAPDATGAAVGHAFVHVTPSTSASARRAQRSKFSFCVSLAGRSAAVPFRGKSAAVTRSGRERQRAATPSGSKVSGWLRGVILRSLASNRDDRFRR
jgi:hypothetical protein